MLGMGHAPTAVLAALSRPLAMCNVMTPSLSQLALTTRLQREIGHTHNPPVCPFSRFVFLNSGSESVTFALRLCDIHSRTQTNAGGPHEGKRTIRLYGIIFSLQINFMQIFLSFFPSGLSWRAFMGARRYCGGTPFYQETQVFSPVGSCPHQRELPPSLSQVFAVLPLPR
jgi:hypothetical protein